MRRSSQEKLRARWLCLGWLVFGALACGEDPVSPPAPDSAQQLCRNWQRQDGSCDLTTLMADYEECQRTQGIPEMERLRQAGRRNRMVHLGAERATTTCLELRRWVMTEEGRRSRLAHPPNRPGRPS